MNEQQQGDGSFPKVEKKGDSWWARQFSLPVWVLALSAVVLLSVGTGIGGGGGEDMTAELAAAEQRLEQVEQRLAEAEDARKAAETEAREAKAAARADLESEYAKREQELANRAAVLDAREAKVSQAEEVAAMSTFGDGVYEVGVDILAGKYRAEGGSPCYWQKSPVDDSDEIIDNGLVNGPTTVVIQEGILFTSQDCGTWTKQD